MNPYGMTIIAQGREIEIPVLPPKLKVTSSGNNDKATVLELGDILILRKKGLRSIAWDSFFPVNDAPFVTGRLSAPLDIVQAIQAARDTLEPVRFLITGTDLDINVRMGVETFDYEERSGELGDFYYSRPIRSKKATVYGISRRLCMAREATIQRFTTRIKG